LHGLMQSILQKIELYYHCLCLSGTDISIMDNLLINISNEILYCIFELCGRAIAAMKLVSHEMERRIMAWLPSDKNNHKLIDYGVWDGFPNIIDWVIGTRTDDHNRIIMKIYLNITKRYETYYEIARIYSTAISLNHLSMLKFVCEYDPTVIECACMEAFGFGCIELTKWIYDRWKNSGGTRFNINHLVRYAIFYENLPVIKWILQMESNSINMERYCIYAALSQKMEILKWIVLSGHILNREIYYILACNSQPTGYQWISKIVEWLEENDPNWNSELYLTMKEDTASMALVL
jgi:hypothetical protein